MASRTRVAKLVIMAPAEGGGAWLATARGRDWVSSSSSVEETRLKREGGREDARYVLTLECPTPLWPLFFSRERRTTAARTLALSAVDWPVVVVPPESRLMPACVLTDWRAAGLGLGLGLRESLCRIGSCCCCGAEAMAAVSKRVVERRARFGRVRLRGAELAGGLVRPISSDSSLAAVQARKASQGKEGNRRTSALLLPSALTPASVRGRAGNSARSRSPGLKG